MARKSGPPPAPTGGAVPEWALSYGDLMSLLLVFFILMFAFSEIKKPKFDMAIGSLKSALGERDTPAEASNIRARNSTGLRPQSPSTTFGEEGVVGDAAESTIRDQHPRTSRIAEGSARAIGLAGMFESGSSRLDSGMRRQLIEFAGQEQGHQTKIEVRGHAGAREAEDPWALGLERARSVMQFLTDPAQGNLLPDRFRLSSGGVYEVDERTGDPVEDRIGNRRVEIFVTQQRVQTPPR
ncbi:MAG: OmpA family protein [Planctomycetes bacterium]|nr:OmpA family protein [Planctomycetota bacterium]